MLICVTVEDVSNLWLNVKESFERRVPVKKACLNNKARNPVFVDNLPAEFIQTTDSRLRSRFPQEQYLFWFREPYATVVLVTCEVLATHIPPLILLYANPFDSFSSNSTREMDHVDDFAVHLFIYIKKLFIYIKNVQDLDEFKTILKPRLKLIVQNDEREWFIVFVSKAHPSNDQATKMAKKVYARLEADFNTKKRERYLLRLLHDSICLGKKMHVLKLSSCSNPAFRLLLFCSYVFFHELISTFEFSMDFWVKRYYKQCE